MHVYNFTLTTNLISFTWRPSKALESLSQAPGKALSFILLPALADQRSAPNQTEKILLIGYVKSSSEQFNRNATK